MKVAVGVIATMPPNRTNIEENKSFGLDSFHIFYIFTYAVIRLHHGITVAGS